MALPSISKQLLPPPPPVLTLPPAKSANQSRLQRLFAKRKFDNMAGNKPQRQGELFPHTNFVGVVSGRLGAGREVVTPIVSKGERIN